MMLIGKLCYIMHRATPQVCSERLQTEGKELCTPKFLNVGDQSKATLVKRGFEAPELMLDWFFYRTQATDPKLGGNITDSEVFSGNFGKYLLTEGYYSCYNPYDFKDAQ